MSNFIQFKNTDLKLLRSQHVLCHGLLHVDWETSGGNGYLLLPSTKLVVITPLTIINYTSTWTITVTADGSTPDSTNSNAYRLIRYDYADLNGQSGWQRSDLSFRPISVNGGEQLRIGANKLWTSSTSPTTSEYMTATFADSTIEMPMLIEQFGY